MSRAQLATVAVLVVLVTSCERERRRFDEPVAFGDRSSSVPIGTGATSPVGAPAWQPPYGANSAAMGDGKRLWVWFNCAGCHAGGGGGMGPPMIDDRWRYGSAPEDVFRTIVDGRPDGMPAFRGKIPDAQIWQLVAYVRSMSGNARMDAVPGRGDTIHGGTPEAMRKRAEPRHVEPPPP